MITPKKRFEVLKRDGFRCKYCGRNGENVSLEVDHIIPKSKGGGDEMDNLICCCRECNMGKGNNDVAIPAIISYKTKITDTCYKLKTYFYEEWNKRKMGTIDKRTVTLINIICDYEIKGVDGKFYCTMLDFWGLYGKDSPYGDDRRKIDHYKMDKLFQEGGNFCDDVLDCIYGEQCGIVDDIIEYVYDKKNWNWSRDDDYSGKLNYSLTEHLAESYGNIIKKYSLFPHLINNG